VSSAPSHNDVFAVISPDKWVYLFQKLHEFADVRGVTYDKLCAELKECYDGYHFTHHSIILPYSHSHNKEAENGQTPLLLHDSGNLSGIFQNVRHTLSFFRRLQSFFADTTYEVIRDQELHYENVLFIVFKLVGRIPLHEQTSEFQKEILPYSHSHNKEAENGQTPLQIPPTK